MKALLSISVLLLLTIGSETSFSQAIIASHQSTQLSQVPEQWINQAKADFKIWYGHTSHGSQITSGMSNLQSHYGEPYTYNSSGSGGALSYQETGGDLGHNGDLTWYWATRAKLDEPANDRNVVMWSWCGGVSDNTPEGIDIYLNAMSTLETDYPDVKFIYMTGHRDIWSDENLKARNQQIRDYCIENDKILFDFADIESYNPDLVYFEFANDNCDYYEGPAWGYLGNWADEWCAENPGSDLCWDCYCAHSKSLNCNLKGRAFWWMMARMAGWYGQEQSWDFHAGWNNFSSYVTPESTDLEDLFADLLPNMLVLQNQDGVFCPELGLNTIGDWDSNSGYLIKMIDSASLSFPGFPLEELNISLIPGWNFIPVLCAEGMSIFDLADQLGNNLIFVQEAAGTGIYWPEMGIQTIQNLEAGKSYYLFIENSASLLFDR